MQFKINKFLTLKKVAAIFILLLPTYIVFFKTNSGQQAQNHQTQPLEVKVVRLAKQKVQLTLELPGRVAAYKISEIRPQVDGIIKKIKFVEGSFVKQGQSLYQIDPNVYQIASDSANANLKALEAKKERYRNLLEFEAVSKQEYDDVEAAFIGAKSDAKRAETNLTYSRILAPISGYIGKSNITEGRLVTTNQAEVLTTITQLDPIYVDMSQPTKDMIALGSQKEITVTLNTDDPNYKNSGRLKFSEMFADETTDSVRLRAKFSNKDKKLIPGMFVTAKLHLKPISTIMVPQRATTRNADGNLIVWLINGENIAKPMQIKAEQAFGDSWIVSEGLNDGDVLVLEGYQKLSEGIKVSPYLATQESKDVQPNSASR